MSEQMTANETAQRIPSGAGKAMDALVAERIFTEVEAHAPCGDGLTRTATFVAGSLAQCDADIREHYAKRVAAGMKLWPAKYCGPAYSIDVSAALDALSMVGGIIRIERYRNADDPSAYVWHVGDTNNGRTTRHAPTLPLAICLYLLAVTEPAATRAESRS